VFKRKATPAPVQPASVPSAVSAEADVSRVLSELLSKPTLENVLEGALTHAAVLLGGYVRGLGILRRGQDRVGAVLGYPRDLLGMTLSGPWSTGRMRLLEGGARELYDANGPELAATFDAAGMRAVGLSLVVPIMDRGRHSGALLLDRVAEGGIAPAQQEAVGRFAQAVGPLLGLIEGRDEWRQAARQITATVIEAMESREFDSLGHARAVAEIATRLGRSVGLAGRELDELWYAATLHDVGKIQGESGHALVGANLLQGVAALGEAEKGVRHHHERWDGQGEPDRLSGEDIPLYARLVAVANAYVRLGDVKRVQAQAGKALDPKLVAALEKMDQPS
jgi:HD domain